MASATVKRIVAAAAAACALVLAVGTIGVASTYKTITIKVGQAHKKINTWASTPQAALSAANVRVGSNDIVYPAPGARLSDGDTVSVRQTQPVAMRQRGVWRLDNTPAQSVMALVGASAKMVADKTVAVRLPQDERRLPLAANKLDVAVAHDGKLTTVAFDPSKSVRDNLRAAKIEVGPLDRLEVVNEKAVPHAHGVKNSIPGAGAGQTSVGSAVGAEVLGASHAVISLTRIERSVTEEKDVTKAPVEEREDDSLPKGKEKVLEEGSDGVRIKRVMRLSENGKVVRSKVLSDIEVSKVAKRVIAKGTKEVEGAGAATFSGDDPFAAIAQCESHGNPSTNTGNGYYGMYQFSLGTWQSVGGSGLPSDASAEEQTKRAKILQARSGWGQWGACSARLGLR